MAETKARGPLFWVILAVGALLAIFVVILVSIGYFASQESQFGLKQGNSVLGVLERWAQNGGMEVIRQEPDKLQILCRDKKTGEYFYLRADAETKSISRVPVRADQVK